MHTPKSKIYSLRKEKDLTQVFLANRLGISTIAYRRLEKETSVAYSIIKVILLCRLFSCEPRDLLIPSNALTSESCEGSPPDLEQIRQNWRTGSGDSSPKTRIPKFLAELCESKGITPSQIQSALDVSKSTIRNWRKDCSCPTLLRSCIILCEIFDCHIEDLVDGIPEEQAAAVDNLLQRESQEKTRPEKSIAQINSNFKKSLSDSSYLEDGVSRQQEMEVIE